MAQSKIKAQTHSYKEQDYIFVDQPEENLKDLECPICQDIVSEPLLTSCGHLFCRECYNNKGRDPQCPVCRQTHTTVPDNRTNRLVKSLRVRCVNHQYGCKWVGDLSDEVQHRTTQGSCQFEEIPCPYNCGNTIHRMTQACHLQECPKRPHRCRHCNKVGPHQYVEGDHRKSCLRYPVRCPNGCDKRIPREETASYRLKKELFSMKERLRLEEHCTRELEEDAKAKAECIRQLEWNITTMTRHISDLERDNQAMKKRTRQLKRDTEVKTEQIHELQRDTAAKSEWILEFERATETRADHTNSLEREVNSMTEQICGLQSDNESKKERIHDLELDGEDKEERIHHLEGQVKAMTQHICDFERNAKDMTEQLQKESEANTECIREHEKAAKAKDQQICHLEGIAKSRAQRITRLTAENSERQRKLQYVKKLIVFALGVVILFHLNPLYFIPLLVLLLTVVYA